MTRSREELDLGDGLGVTRPGVDGLLGEEALLQSWFRRLEVDVDVGRDVEVGATEVVV